LNSFRQTRFLLDHLRAGGADELLTNEQRQIRLTGIHIGLAIRGAAEMGRFSHRNIRDVVGD
jgi:hypothetical protein